MRSARNQEGRLRADLREADHELEKEREYSTKVTHAPACCFDLLLVSGIICQIKTASAFVALVSGEGEAREGRSEV